jgi:uncharacterized damage-inducible protein DinB
MSDHPPIAQMREELRRTQRDFLDILGQADARTLHHRAADGVWTLAEVLAHISNARQFFGGEAARGVASPNSRVGRMIQDAGRLAAVRDHGQDSADVLRKAIVTSHEQLMGLLEKLSDEDLKISAEHVNPKFGRLSIGDFVSHFIVEHDQKHVEQARRSLAHAKQ